MNEKRNIRPLEKNITRQQSENIDFAEKYIDSPLNPQKKDFKADPEDQDVVLTNTGVEQKHPHSE